MTLQLERPALAQAPAMPARSGAAWKIALATIIVAAFLGRVMLARMSDLNLDEACSYLFVIDPRGILAALRRDVHPPLFFMVLKAWTLVFGTSPLSLRMPAVLAGSLSVGAVVLLLRRLGASRRTCLWGAALTAVMPMQVEHSAEARSYTFLFLLVTLALWAWMRSVESGRWRDWALHGLLVLVGVYMHHLMFPMMAAFWIAALLERLSWRGWGQMVATYAVIVAAAFPSLRLLLSQDRVSHGEEWVGDLWRVGSPIGIVGHSLAALGTTGGTPVGDHRVTTIVYTVLGVGTSLAALWALFGRGGRPVPEQDGLEKQRHLWMVVAAAAWPVFFLWAYSTFRKPLYVYGRYDIIAQPGVIVLLAFGLSRCQGLLKERWGGVAGALLAVAVLVPTAWHSIGVKEWRQVTGGPGIFTARAEILQGLYRPGDVVIASNLEYAPMRYIVDQEHLAFPLQSFPPDIVKHPGWILGDQELAGEIPKWTEVAREYFSAPSAPSRVFVLLDRWAPPPGALNGVGSRGQLTINFFEQAFKAGYHFPVLSPRMKAEIVAAQLVILEK